MDETLVVMITGNGLKDVASAMRVAGEGMRIEPKLEDLKRIFKS